MTTTPMVSIIVPIYNAAKPWKEGKTVLHRCIDSVLTQEYKDFELLLMDDGSKDDSPAILDEYAAKDDRIRVVHKPNSGVSDTRNKALDMACGTYIQFMDADDWITPDATKLFVRRAQETDADLVIAHFYRVVGELASLKGDIETEEVFSREDYAEYMMKNPADYYYGVIWNKFFKKSILDANHLRMDESLRWCEDFIFNMEYILHVDKIASLRAPVYYYVKTEGSLVAQGMKVSKIVKMKLNVINYYNDFYKSIYQGTEYAIRQPAIYSFLVSWAGDDAAVAVLPGTKKLGEEKAPVFESPDDNSSPFTRNYYSTKLLDRLLTTIAQQFGLDLSEVKVLLYLMKAQTLTNYKEGSDLTGLTPVAFTAKLEQLALKKLVSQSVASNGLHAVLTEEATPIVNELAHVVPDYDQICLEGFDEDEKELYLALSQKALSNLRKHLQV